MAVGKSPRQEFQEKKNAVHNHREMITVIEDGLKTGLLQYQYELTTADATGNQAAANFYKLCGAREFVRVLENLGVIPPKVTQVTSPNLDHST